jgi:hypothetical protein
LLETSPAPTTRRSNGIILTQLIGILVLALSVLLLMLVVVVVDSGCGGGGG